MKRRPEKVPYLNLNERRYHFIMRLLNLHEVQQLLVGVQSPCVSLYLSRPRNELGARIATTKMTYLLRKTENLLKQSLPFKDIRKFMRPLWNFKRDLFWKNHSSLAMFHSSGVSGYLPLTSEVTELTVVADSFHLKPILKRLKDQGQRLWVLSLGQNKVTLFRWVNRQLDPIETIYAGDNDKSGLRFMINADGASRANVRSHLYDFQLNIADPDQHRENLHSFFRKVDSIVQQHLAAESLPLVLAGVRSLRPIFHGISRYPLLTHSGIDGSFENTALQPKLLLRVNEFAAEINRAQDQKARTEYEEAALAEQGLDELSMVTKAAFNGQVRKLFVAEDRQIWGVLDESKATAILHPAQMTTRDDDILDDLAELVLKKGGKVHVLPACKMPTTSPIAAILRWPYAE
jgi:hypothetical protein